MNQQEIKNLIIQTIQEQNQQNQFRGSNIPVHTHNGTDSVKIPPTSVTNFVALPANNTGTSSTAGVLSTNNIGVSTPPYSIVYPEPVIKGYGVGGFSAFNGGDAPFGSVVVFQNAGTPLYQLWVRVENGSGVGIWKGITLNLTA